MRPTEQTRNLQAQIDDLTAQLSVLRADLQDLTNQQDSPTTERDRSNDPHQFDQNGHSIFIGDTVLFRPPGTRSGCTIRTRGIITRFTAQRVYLRRENDNRRRPQEILRDPAHTRLV